MNNEFEQVSRNRQTDIATLTHAISLASFSPDDQISNGRTKGLRITESVEPAALQNDSLFQSTQIQALWGYLLVKMV